MKILCIFLLSLTALHPGYLSAEEISFLNNIRIDSSMTVKDNFYYYSFKLFNTSSNTGQISSINIDIEKPANSVELSSQGLVLQTGLDYRGNMINENYEDSVKELGTKLNKHLIPVGARPAKGWSSDISVDGTISWGSQDKKHRILPGQSSGEFQIISSGLPSICNIHVRPKWVAVANGYVSEEDIERSLKVKKEITIMERHLVQRRRQRTFNLPHLLNRS
jgi:hypothetical protein